MNHRGREVTEKLDELLCGLCVSVVETIAIMPTNRIKSDLVTCPICRKRFDPLASRPMPFCSERCRLIDLGRWLGEEYSVPAPKNEAEQKADESEE